MFVKSVNLFVKGTGVSYFSELVNELRLEGQRKPETKYEYVLK
jgi:hypothetical protein